MSGFKYFAVTLFALSFMTAAAAEIQLPVKMADVAEQMNRKCPAHAKIEAREDELVIVMSESSGKGSGFEGQYSIDLKRYAGRTATVMIDVKVGNLSRGDRKVPLPGKVYFNGTGQSIHANSDDWQTLTFKSLRLPGNGLVKFRISLRNFSGEVSFRVPRAKIDLSKRDRDGDRKKKKKDKKKDN